MAGRCDPNDLGRSGSDVPVISAVEAFDGFYQRELPGVLSLCYALVRRPEYAEEVAQEAFYRAWRDWGTVGRLEHRRAWIRRVAMNLAVSRLRRLGAEARAMVRLRGKRSQLDLEPSVDTEHFWVQVRALPRRQAQVVALYCLEDRSTADIAELLGIAESTVRVHLARAKATMGAVLEGEH
ncbi:MAG: sigma-70 family RNA polymerase sigma factor [Acidimicrobiia bacterium]|nr:sigma-70 family RNA polymerase sigma factor [Acidimicrobiia bacterium]